MNHSLLLRAQILLKTPLPSIDEVFSSNVHEEHQRTINHAYASVSFNNVALLVTTKQPKRFNGNDRLERSTNVLFALIVKIKDTPY